MYFLQTVPNTKHTYTDAHARTRTHTICTYTHTDAYTHGCRVHTLLSERLTKDFDFDFDFDVEEDCLGEDDEPREVDVEEVAEEEGDGFFDPDAAAGEVDDDMLCKNKYIPMDFFHFPTFSRLPSPTPDSQLQVSNWNSRVRPRVVYDFLEFPNSEFVS